MARKQPKPYHVVPVQSSDIVDWKSYSQRRGILRVRSSEDGKNVDWTKFMQIQISKNEPDTIRFKYSHTDEDFSKLKIGNIRRSGDGEVLEPQVMFQTGSPKLSLAKYEDLKSVCTGNAPVISHPEYQKFYLSLPHKT